QARRLVLEALHALGGRGKGAADVEAVGVERRVRAEGARLDGGEAMLDLAAVGHAAEQDLAAAVGEQAFGEVDEWFVHVVIGNRSGDPIEVSRHADLLEPYAMLRRTVRRTRGARWSLMPSDVGLVQGRGRMGS